MFGPKRGGSMGVETITERAALWSLLLTKYYCGDQLKKSAMGWTCGTYERRDTCIQGFGGKTRGKDVSTHPSTKELGKRNWIKKKNADLGSRLSQVCLTPSLRTDADLGVKETFRITCSWIKIAPEGSNRHSDTYVDIIAFSLHFNCSIVIAHVKWHDWPHTIVVVL